MTHLTIMPHLTILPVLVPLIGGALLMLPPLVGHLQRQRLTGIACSLILLAVSINLIQATSNGQMLLYAVGDWQPPFGILLVADRLSTMMILLTSLLGLGSLLYACAGTDEQGALFHPLFQFQLMGINGAFLTGDIFNLFVFFEVLLIASYALLMHGGGKPRTRAGLHYVVLNLAASAVFLTSLGILYGTLGTLNMADLAVKVQQLPESEAPLVAVGAMLMLFVFGLKAAILPLHFWLPQAYSAASAPVAALFAIMTKVGIYAILRIYTLIFGDDAGTLSHLIAPWLWPTALLTLIFAAIGLFTSPNLRRMVAWLVLMSVGSILAVVSFHRPEATGAALYYLLHTTLVTGGLFLLMDMISQQRYKASDRIVSARPVAQPALLGGLFFLGSIAVIGMPPLSGFVGKALLLKSAYHVNEMIWYWPALLGSSLLAIIALSRAGSSIFWRVSGAPSEKRTHPLEVMATLVLLASSPLMTIFGGTISEFTHATALQLYDTHHYIEAVLSVEATP